MKAYVSGEQFCLPSPSAASRLKMACVREQTVKKLKLDCKAGYSNVPNE